MKLSLLAATLMMALALSACKRPEQALPANTETYGTRTEEGSTLDEERGPGAADDKSSAAPADSATAVAAAPAAEEEDEFSGPAVLPGHRLDGNGNPLPEGASGIPAGH